MNKLLILVFFILFIVIQNGESHNHDIAGDIVSAKCECGFEAELFIGAGKSDYKTSCKFPFYCNDCSSLTLINALDEKQNCRKCNSENVISYENDSLRAGKSNKSVFGWNVNGKTFLLTDDSYLCPQCKEFKLSFTQIGNWD